MTFYYAEKGGGEMARERSPNRDKAFELYKESNGEIQNREIANILGISEKTVSGWKVKDKWNSKLNGVLQTNERSTPKDEKNKKKKKELLEKEVEEVVESDGLTDKQRLFCIYCVEYLNATKAYQKAYECSYRVANVNGSRLLVNASVKAEVDRLKSEAIQGELFDMKLIAKKAFQKYIDIALADITDYLTFGRRQIEMPDGPRVVNYVDLKESVEVDGTIITEVSQGKDGVKVKLADKMRALEFLAKHTGLLSADVVQKLEMEREKLSILKCKEEPNDEEVEDDGFITALSAQVESVWDDEE